MSGLDLTAIEARREAALAGMPDDPWGYGVYEARAALADIEPLVERVKAGDALYEALEEISGLERDQYWTAVDIAQTALAAYEAARPAREVSARLRCPVCGDEVSCDACWAREAREEEALGG